LIRDETDYFAVPRIAALRREIEEQGLVADDFLNDDPDCPVYGVNLACAHPFPASVNSSYDGLAKKLERLDAAAYVYPFWETHITIITFVNFSRHRRPTAEKIAELEDLIRPAINIVRDAIAVEKIEAFEIELRPPVLTKKAAIFPVLNLGGEIPRIRRRAIEILQSNQRLHDAFLQAGLNIPGIMHSTVMRFKRLPEKLSQFLAAYDAVIAETPPMTVRIHELLITAETKPYMRGGQRLHRFELAS
jgi:hypothetical protein